MNSTDPEQHGAATMSGAARRIRRALRASSVRAGSARLSNIVAGASTVLEIMPSGSHRRIDASRFMAPTDAEAIGEDWRAVGDDLRAAAQRAR